jgi:hypothetical protein
MKQKTLIVIQDGRPDLERTARGLLDRLDSEKNEARVKAASEITIPELLATSFFLFGADEAHPSCYSEIARVLSGINLAGRKAAYFGATGSAVAWLREMTADSELGSAGSDLLGSKPEAAAISAWVRALS